MWRKEGWQSGQAQVGTDWAPAALVHLFTALGIICALFALLAVFERAWEQTFLWLGVALMIDGLDGTLARFVEVERRLPRISGERLDQVVDYVTYVLVPVLALLEADYLSGPGGVLLAALILLSALYHFADLGNKSEDHCFVGFPAIWNIVAFYVFAFALSVSIVALLVLVCVALTFVPMHWAHPMRLTTWWQPTAAVTVLWGLAAIWALWAGFPAHPLAQGALAAAALYGVSFSVIRAWGGRPAS